MITKDGKVGIGTTDPKNELQIGPQFVLHSKTSNYIGFNCYWVEDAPKYMSGGYSSIIRLGRNISFGVTDITGSENSPLNINYAMNITDNGNVGIGTDLPNAKLDIRGKIYVKTDDDAILTFDNIDNSWQYIEFKNSGVRKIWMGLDDINNFQIVKENGGNI
ncbi:MAG: hypothetical protein HY738_10725, partial [Bacteroidia bacterium]|nr:hypothetical protein [Bacteroidia bacterium]